MPSRLQVLNVVALAGRVAGPPRERSLPSGDRLVTYEVTIPSEEGRAETVPVVWLGAPSRAAAFAPGDAVVVVGRVRRRFFRGRAGATESRTEVVAERVVAAAGSPARAALARAARRLGGAP
jgi:single-strand DNA-binding protein